MALDERLESVASGVKTLNHSLEPLLQSAPTPTPDASNEEPSEAVLLIRKHATFMSEWESVQEESEVLREELKEDKWLTVFRTVTEQADGMMSSLEKAITRCQVSDASWPRGELIDITCSQGFHLAVSTTWARRFDVRLLFHDIYGFCAISKIPTQYGGLSLIA